MTSLQPPLQGGIHFRDTYDRSREGWQSYSQYADFVRALTPPEDNQSRESWRDMTGVTRNSKPGYYEQEHGQIYGDYMSSQPSYRGVAPYLPQDLSNAEYGRNGVATQPNSRTISPVYQHRQTTVDDSHLQQAHQRRESQANAIAPSFQIPKSVNDSGGSLSELAAQITCLFWFEESELLQRVEDSSISIVPPRLLLSDAKPSTGFRKWVTTILSTTLVAQNVVLLALLFVYRLKKLNPGVQGKPGSEYRLLTVALMLGNKFLDDNTYTNKTWAEVSGISVNEVHIMEVEFLSNMKYCLFTSADDWSKWQTLLGKFATFFERASRPQQLAPILPPASSLHLPMALPSPPASNQASPPYVADVGQANGVTGQHGPTPAPSPLAYMTSSNTNNYQNSRKRSLDEYAAEPPPKRVASSFQNYQSPQHYASGPANTNQNQPVPRLALPSLPMPSGQTSSNYAQPTSQAQQLPPLKVPARAMAMVYPNTTNQPQLQQMAALAGPSSQPQSQTQSQYQSRQQSPYQASATASPNAMPISATSLHPPAQISPTYFLQQRNSPYRPVHNVSTLLYPPPSSALSHRPQSIEYNQMHYQPLGKPIQQRQSGRLPYVSQNVYVDGSVPGAMTPVHHWPSFMHTQQQQVIAQQSN